MTHNYQEQIEQIQDHFDYHKVHLAMQALDWHWHSTDGVPEQSELRRQSRLLLQDLAASTNTCHASGGFIASRDSDGYLSLTFAIDDYSTNPEY